MEHYYQVWMFFSADFTKSPTPFPGLWPLCHLRYLGAWGRLLTTYRFPGLWLNPRDHQQGLLKDPESKLFLCSFTVRSGLKSMLAPSHP